MANWHGYIGIENFGLNVSQRNELIDALRGLGPSSHPQPACLNHCRIRPDYEAVIYEALFNEAEVTLDVVKGYLANIFDIDPNTITHSVRSTKLGPVVTFTRGVDRLRLIQFGGVGSDWMVSGDACRKYLHNNWLAPLEGPSPVGQSEDWDLIFQDEFDADVLDTDIWTDRYWYNNGQQINHGGAGMFAPDDAYLQDGKLRLRAQKRDVIADDGTPYNYSTGYVSTSGMAGGPPPSFEFLYGYAEVRARVPAGYGFLSAFWAVNSNFISPGYDPTRWEGEIDVFEIFGHETNKCPMAYHWKNDTPDAVHAKETWEGPDVPDFSEDFHVFGFEWKPDEIIWYVDGIERWRHNENIQSTPMFLILSLFVGHAGYVFPDESTPFPSYFDIDYVRVWAKGG